jgi:hypothetical protein
MQFKAGTSSRKIRLRDVQDMACLSENRQEPGGGPFPAGGVSVGKGINVAGGGKSVPGGPSSTKTTVGGGGAPVPGGTSVTEDRTVGGGEEIPDGGASVGANSTVTPGGGSKVPTGGPGSCVLEERGADGVPLRVDVARTGGPERALPVGVGLEFESEIPETNVTRIAIKKPTSRRITIMDLFFCKKLMADLSFFNI